MGDLSRQIEGGASQTSLPVMRFNTEFSEAYVQTRHKNLRCFPICCPLHMEKSFCGRVMEVDVKFPPEALIAAGRPQLVGEFRCTVVPPTFRIGDSVSAEEYRKPRFILAELVLSEPLDLRFVLNPNRKWFYPRTTAEGELHVYTVYLIVGDVVVAQLDSPSFKVLPIWKEERRPSMPGIPAGPKPIPMQALPQPHGGNGHHSQPAHFLNGQSGQMNGQYKQQRMFGSGSDGNGSDPRSYAPATASQAPPSPALPWSNMASYQQPLGASAQRQQQQQQQQHHQQQHHEQQQQQQQQQQGRSGHNGGNTHSFAGQPFRQQFTPVSSSMPQAMYNNPFLQSLYEVQQQQQQQQQQQHQQSPQYFAQPPNLTQQQQQYMSQLRPAPPQYTPHSAQQPKQQQQQSAMAQYAMAMSAAAHQLQSEPKHQEETVGGGFVKKQD